MSAPIEDLRAINRKLEAFLSWIGKVEEQPASLVPDEIFELLNSVLEAGKCLNAGTLAVTDPEWLQETHDYQTNLERLRGVLPLLEISLRIARAKLEGERAHLEAVNGWLTASHHTF